MAKIVIIDDDEGILDAIKVALEAVGHQVEAFADGNDALLSLNKHSLPEMILLDILLSGQDGRKVCQQVKTQPRTNHIPVVILSAHPSAEATITQFGADGFLAKPFDIDDLEQTINLYLNHRPS